MRFLRSFNITNGAAVRRSWLSLAFVMGLAIAGCAPMNVPGTRTVDIPSAAKVEPRTDALNENRQAVLTIPLGKDVLVPEMKMGGRLSMDEIGPFELRSETLASALQLVLAGYDVPIAFETEKGLQGKITVANLKGSVDQVVRKLCSLADLYCTYEAGILEVKEEETFTVSLPPLDESSFTNIATGLQAVADAETVIDTSTRTLIYTVTQRNADRARRYFDRIRANTALIVYETYIWEVQLDSINSAGIRWEGLQDLGTFNSGVSIDTGLSSQVGNPITIGLPTQGNVNFGTGDILRFLSEQGAVKTISQPQLTVLSGSEASLRVAETINYVESLTRSVDDDGDETFSSTTASVDTGFNLNIASSWDESTVYASIELDIDEVLGFQEFSTGDTGTVELPRTSERQLTTQVRSRPGDSILIAGLVRERDEYDAAGLGTSAPIIPTGRTGQTDNTELVILLRPRVVRYIPQEEIEEENKVNNESLATIIPQSKPFSLESVIGKDEEMIEADGFDIDMLLDPSITVAPMEEK